MIVSSVGKATEFFTEHLRAMDIAKIVTLSSISEARRLLLERDFDLIIVNAPLRDETGEQFSRQVAIKGMAQVLLVVSSEHFEEISAICEDDGVLTIAKPIHRAVFWSALKLVKASQNRLKREQAENVKLKQKIEDIRLVDRAKCVLISHMNMSEKEAHRYIEKQAMDMRQTKREIAEGILKTYEN